MVAKSLPSQLLAPISDAMTQVAVSRRNSTLGRYVPRRFNAVTRERLFRDRMWRYLAQLPGPPTDRQAQTIQTLCRLEYSALKAEASDDLRALREAREFRRLLERLRDDWERAIDKSAAKEHPRSIAEYYARVAAEKEAAAHD
jgi:hypothetical protein